MAPSNSVFSNPVPRSRSTRLPSVLSDTRHRRPYGTWPGGYTVKPTPCVSHRNTSTSQHGPVFRIRQCFTRISHSRSSRSAHGPTVGLSTCGRPFPSIRYALTTKFRPLIPSMTQNSAKSRAQRLPSFPSPHDIPAATGTNSSLTSAMQRNTTTVSLREPYVYPTIHCQRYCMILG
jgi:hypothetical protein